MEQENNQVVIGNLYDINKSLMKNAPVLNEGILNSKKEIIKNFIYQQEDNYFMLLCNERADYTVFGFTENQKESERCLNCAKCLIDECLANRGEIRAIDLTKGKNAIEIWMSIDNEIYVYYFFPYDVGVITDF